MSEDAGRPDGVRRSLEPITDGQIARLVELAFRDMDRLPPGWQETLSGVFLAQGGAQHFIDGSHGVKDFDVWSVYVTRTPAEFPWKGPRKRHVDFGLSPHGRNFYTPAERSHPVLGPKIRRWQTFQGRRVDLMTRALPPHPEGVRGAVRAWLSDAAGKKWQPPPKRMSSPWWLARRPVIELWPEAMTVVWDPSVDLPPDADPAPPQTDDP